jgi:predicted site-specific integrase-resolvase
MFERAGRRYYTAREAAERLGVGIATFNRWYYSNPQRYVAVRVGTNRLYTEAIIELMRVDHGARGRWQTADGERLLTGAQAARALGISRAALSSHYRRGHLAATGRYSKARRPLFREGEVRALGERLGREVDGRE